MRIFTTAAILIALCVSTVTHAAESLTLGVQDYGKTSSQLAAEFKSLDTYLSKQIGQPVTVYTSQNYGRFMKGAKQKRYTFIYGPPTMAMEAHRLFGSSLISL